MNEKSNPMPMMYKTIPAVAELNKVPGFDPLKFLRHKVSRKTNEEMLQLELPYQKLWFRLRHPQGRMKLTTLRITEQLAIMEARVYLDRSDAEPISSYISQHSAEEGTDYVQAAQDEALRLRCRMPVSVCSLPMLLLTVRARCLEAVFRFPGRLLSGNRCQMRRRGP